MWFIYGPPTSNPFGRDEEIRTLIGLVKNGQPVSLIGPRRIGKTSIILASLSRSSLPYVLFSAEEFIKNERGFNFQEFLSAYVSKVTNLALSLAGLKFQFTEKTRSYLKQLRELIGGVKIYLNMPEISALIDIILDKAERGKELDEEFNRVLDLPQIFAERLGIERLIIAIDEFQYLKYAKQSLPEIFHLMRSKWQFQRNVSYLISGSAVGMLKEIVSGKEQPFYQFFYSMKVNPFNRETSRNFLKKGFETEGINVSDHEIEAAVDYVDGFPAWLNLVGIKAVIERRSIRQILEDLPRDENVINAIEGDIRKLSPSAKSVLRKLATLGGKGRLKDLGDDVWTVNRGISQLTRYGYVEKEERGIYRIVDPMVVHYLNQGYKDGGSKGAENLAGRDG
ncbi:putative ATPase (AAA+ superfamily) [Metallosphaera yellowstonensis MK1]|uniref:Putative ATPase (AAA+ superfamily) n=1 Tax=Metallosphaera yellowstonensis MK1 TaxID=671065 RepID=H2C788_9CREN|nr:ATP-binding protein [Metallosphaera yellowstonensis]EHP68014.1 putative ATPase (AAA+ superfamily) [Metallosphaera yellowstonensis MK1]